MLVNMMFRPVSNQFQYDTAVNYCPKQVDTITGRNTNKLIIVNLINISIDCYNSVLSLLQ